MKKIMITILSTMFLFSLFGCKKNDGPIAGGVTDKTDPNAPKVIESEQIVEFDTNYFSYIRWSGDENHKFEFKVVKENNQFVLYENNRNIKCDADDSLLENIQKVIEDNNLVSRNGVYKITAGLPVEYQPCNFYVKYDSGEELQFTINNEPCDKWSADLYDVINEYLLSKDIDTLSPTKEESLVNNFMFSYKQDNLIFDYQEIDVEKNKAIKNNTHLLMNDVYDENKQEVVYQEMIVIPDDYYQIISDILSKHDVVTKYDFSTYNYLSNSFDNHSLGYYGFSKDSNSKDSESYKVELYATYESEKSIDITTTKSSEIEGMRLLVDDLINYYDGIFKPYIIK